MRIPDLTAADVCMLWQFKNHVAMLRVFQFAIRIRRLARIDKKQTSMYHGRAKYQMPNMPNAKYQMPSARMPNAECQMPNAECRMPKCQTRWLRCVFGDQIDFVQTHYFKIRFCSDKNRRVVFKTYILDFTGILYCIAYF